MMLVASFLLGAPVTANAPPLFPPAPQTSESHERPWLPEYPVRARMEGREGTSYVLLAADGAGVIKSCKVQRSSGHEDLDAAACRVAIRRAKIPIEKDDDRVRHYLQPVQWKLAAPPEPPPEVTGLNP